MNCTRVKSSPSAAAKDRAINVFPRPGRSSISTCPPASTVVRISVSAPRLPTTTRPISSSTASQCAVVVAAGSPIFAVIPAPTVAGSHRAHPGRGRVRCRRSAIRSPDPPTPTAPPRTACCRWRETPRGSLACRCPVASSNCRASIGRRWRSQSLRVASDRLTNVSVRDSQRRNDSAGSLLKRRRIRTRVRATRYRRRPAAPRRP